MGRLGPMARLRPFVEREAMWAAGLASLSAISFWATLPAAVFLAVRTIRRRDRGHGDGSEPAFAALALALALVGFWFAVPPMYAIARTASIADDPWRAVAFAAGLVALSAVVIALATYLLRCHPERWIARRLALSGLLTAVVTGGLQAAVALSRSVGLLPACGRLTSSNADCVGTLPWSVLLPAAATGAAFFVISLAASATRRTIRAASVSRHLPARPDVHRP
jgi:hypothetical protein